jgi:hypothetical protein
MTFLLKIATQGISLWYFQVICIIAWFGSFLLFFFFLLSYDCFNQFKNSIFILV